MQMRVPARIRCEIVGDAFRHENVSGIAAIHDALCEIDSRARDICALVDVEQFVNGAAVDSHAQSDLGRILQGGDDFGRAFDRRFWVAEKYEDDAIASRQSN